MHRRGVTRVPGLYAVGLRWQSRRASHFVSGVGADAAFVADRIAAAETPERAARPRIARRPGPAPAPA